ncbi:MAG: DUF2071 domain-containing protein [Verrucomicrobiota bacterium]
MALLPHPVDLTGRLARGWLFLWRSPGEAVRPLVPPGLELVTHRGFAFWNVVACKVEGLRPAAWPEGVPGWDFWQIGYRLMVRHRGRDGQVTEGLYFVRSECGDPLVLAGGNLTTDFHFHPARIVCQHEDRWAYLRVDAGEDWSEAVVDAALPPRLAAGSPFARLEEAAQFLRYRPVALHPLPGGAARAVRVRRDARAWTPRLRQPVDQRWPWLAPYQAEPELCFELPRIPYTWQRQEFLPGPAQATATPRARPRQVVAVRSIPVLGAFAAPAT